MSLIGSAESIKEAILFRRSNGVKQSSRENLNSFDGQ
jgi:hypothetical protein